MKKILIPTLALAMILCAGAAFAKGKAHKAHAAVNAGHVECTVDGQKFTTNTLDECMVKGGTVLNYPGPNGSAPMGAPETTPLKHHHHHHAKAEKAAKAEKKAQ